MHHPLRWLLLLFLALIVTGCATPKRQPASTSSTLSTPNPKAAYNRPYTVRGVKYYPMASSANYRERGQASWYGSESGNTTSMGAPFNPNGLSAAHKTLPLPTLVEVTNLENGKSVHVVVNDRGPFVHGRFIDLSAGAAKAIGLTGVGPVEVVALSGTPAPAPVLQTANKVDSSNPVYLQTGAFQSKENALNMQAKLTALGVAPVQLHTATNGYGQTFFKVMAGPFYREAMLSTIEQRLSSQGIASLRKPAEEY